MPQSYKEFRENKLVELSQHWAALIDRYSDKQLTDIVANFLDMLELKNPDKKFSIHYIFSTRTCLFRNSIPMLIPVIKDNDNEDGASTFDELYYFVIVDSYIRALHVPDNKVVDVY